MCNFFCHQQNGKKMGKAVQSCQMTRFSKQYIYTIPGCSPAGTLNFASSGHFAIPNEAMGTGTVSHSFQVQLLLITRNLFVMVKLYLLTPKCIIFMVVIISMQQSKDNGDILDVVCLVMFLYCTTAFLKYLSMIEKCISQQIQHIL